jgi:hypothetical protein
MCLTGHFVLCKGINASQSHVLIWSDLSSPHECWQFNSGSQAGFPPQGESRPFPFSGLLRGEVFPPEPPVARWPGRNGAEQARARRCLARRSEPLPASTVLAFRRNLDGRRSGNTFPLVSFEHFGSDSRADDSGGAGATIDHSDIRGSEPHGHDPSGAAPD